MIYSTNIGTVSSQQEGPELRDSMPNRGSDYRRFFVIISTIKLGEKIISSDNVTVTVLAIRGDQILIGTEAQSEAQALGEEVNQSILRERAEAPMDPLIKCA